MCRTLRNGSKEGAFSWVQAPPNEIALAGTLAFSMGSALVLRFLATRRGYRFLRGQRRDQGGSLLIVFFERELDMKSVTAGKNAIDRFGQRCYYVIFSVDHHLKANRANHAHRNLVLQHDADSFDRYIHDMR